MNEHPSVHQPAGGPPVPVSFSESERLNQWLYQLIRPALKGKVLEVGSSKGDLSSLFVQDGFALRISDPDTQNCEFLQTRFSEEPMIKGVHLLDIAAPAFETTYRGLIGRFDTLISVNVINQDPNESLRLRNGKQLLQHRGRLIMLLPAHIALYGESEPGFGYWRRSNRQDLGRRLGRDYEVLRTQFFSILTVYHPIKAPNRTNLSKVDQEDRYHEKVPIFRIVEETIPDRTGLYVIVVARKISA